MTRTQKQNDLEEREELTRGDEVRKTRGVKMFTIQSNLSLTQTHKVKFTYEREGKKGRNSNNTEL